jgi:hypothetical protein
MEPETKVIIIGKSNFAGTVAKIAPKPSNLRNWVNVSFTHCNRLYENVPFQLHELYKLDQRKIEEVSNYAN